METCKEKGYSYWDVGRKAGLAPQIIRNLDAQKTWPKLDNFLKICDALDLDIEFVKAGKSK